MKFRKLNDFFQSLRQGFSDKIKWGAFRKSTEEAGEEEDIDMDEIKLSEGIL